MAATQTRTLRLVYFPNRSGNIYPEIFPVPEKPYKSLVEVINETYTLNKPGQYSYKALIAEDQMAIIMGSKVAQEEVKKIIQIHCKDKPIPWHKHFYFSYSISSEKRVEFFQLFQERKPPNPLPAAVIRGAGAGASSHPSPSTPHVILPIRPRTRAPARTRLSTAGAGMATPWEPDLYQKVQDFFLKGSAAPPVPIIYCEMEKLYHSHQIGKLGALIIKNWKRAYGEDCRVQWNSIFTFPDSKFRPATKLKFIDKLAAQGRKHLASEKAVSTSATRSPNPESGAGAGVTSPPRKVAQTSSPAPKRSRRGSAAPPDEELDPELVKFLDGIPSLLPDSSDNELTTHPITAGAGVSHDLDPETLALLDSMVADLPVDGLAGVEDAER